MADGHLLQADVEFVLDAAAQVGAAAHELHGDGNGNGNAVRITLDAVSQLGSVGLNPVATTYDVDEGRQKDDEDGEDAHQGAVQPGLHDPFGNGLQRGRENLGVWGEAAGKRTGKHGSFIHATGSRR